MAEQKTLRAVFVGLQHGHVGSLDPGKTSHGYIQSFRAIPDVEIVGWCDNDAQLVQQATSLNPGTRGYVGMDDLLAKENFDFALVCAPANEVSAYGLKLAQAGKAFFMEKQFARNARELAPLVQAVKASGAICQAGYPWHAHPAMVDLRQLIDEGVFGKPLSIEAQFMTTQVRPGLRKPGSFYFTKDGEGGGILHMLGCHYLHLMRRLAGEVKSVQAMTSRAVGYIEEPLEDFAVAAFEYESGALGSFHTGYAYPMGGGNSGSALSYRGLDGWADWPFIGAAELRVASTHASFKGAPQRTVTYTLPPYVGYGSQTWFLDLLIRFVDAVRHHRQPEVTAEDGLRVLQLIDAVYESARSGRRVDVRYGVDAALA